MGRMILPDPSSSMHLPAQCFFTLTVAFSLDPKRGLSRDLSSKRCRLIFILFILLAAPSFSNPWEFVSNFVRLAPRMVIDSACLEPPDTSEGDRLLGQIYRTKGATYHLRLCGFYLAFPYASFSFLMPLASGGLLTQRTLSVAGMVEQNYVHKTVVIATVFPTLATLAVIGRFVARRLKRLKFWWDDWTALLALVWLWCFCGLLIGSLKYGNGRHVNEVSPEDLEITRMYTFLYQLFYTMDPTTVKISALLLYKRIFITHKFSIFINVMLAIMVLWGIASTLVAIFSCTPVSAFWTEQGYCIPWHGWVVGYAIPNIMFDWIVWLMPIPRIWMMQLPPFQKVALTVVFAVGLVDCIVAIVRIATVAQALGQPDSTYTWIPAQWWTLIHPTLGIITVCLPTMRVFLTKLNLLCNGPPTPIANEKASLSRWPTVGRQNEWRELGISFSGDTDHNLHSNAIALALRHDSEASTVAVSHDSNGVVNGFRLVRHKSTEAGIVAVTTDPRG